MTNIKNDSKLPLMEKLKKKKEYKNLFKDSIKSALLLDLLGN